MGDPGTSDPKLLFPTLGVQEREEFQVQAPGSSLEPSGPSFSNNLYGQHPLFLPSLHQHPARSFSFPDRPAASGAWSKLEFQGVSDGFRSCSEDPDQNRLSYSEDTLDVTARARVGEDDLFTFPHGEADAVTITARDLASLEPGRFLTDSTVDLYLKYLKVKSISPEQQHRFRFFNSFFFRKLLDRTASTGVDEYRVDYLQLRDWVGVVDLFEKDYVFVPVLVSSHWSLLVICHLRRLNPSSLREKKGSPCILHLDPLEGTHEPFESQVKSFILQAWVEKFKASNNLDELHSLFQMRYIQTKVPQQGNACDCGLYILHYIEVFLSKSSLQELFISSFKGCVYFTRPNFGVEVLDKRNSIRHIFLQLSGMSTSYGGYHLTIPSIPQEDVSVRLEHQHRRSSTVKETKSKKWKETETSILLECVVDGGSFNKGKVGAIQWDLIVEKINSKTQGRPLRTKEQCQNRFDTLLKAYKQLNGYCLKMGKQFCQVTEDEKRSLKLATPIGKEQKHWYYDLSAICERRSSLRDQSRKRRKSNVDGDVRVDKFPSSPIHPTGQCPIPRDGAGHSKFMSPSSREFVAEAFLVMDELLRCTFLNLIELCSFEMGGKGRSLEHVCRMLGLIQVQNLLEICNDVYKLRDLHLVKFSHIPPYEESFEDCWMNTLWLEPLDLDAYRKFGGKLLRGNSQSNIFLHVSTIPTSPFDRCCLERIRVLKLFSCELLETFDLENFPRLCYLSLFSCCSLKMVNGWKASKRLGWIEIRNCIFYNTLPDFEYLSSLKEFVFDGWGKSTMPWQSANFSNCLQLRRLEIKCDSALVETMDLKALNLLEVLSFSFCPSLSIIHGLNELHNLRKFKICYCPNLKFVPGLGCLKVLTHLYITHSAVSDIRYLQDLHSLIHLDLSACESLESLPPLGHMKALANVNISFSNIEEIFEVENMVSLEYLHCVGSKLTHLPNLDHLPRFVHADVNMIPMVGQLASPMREYESDDDVSLVIGVDDVSSSED